MTKLVELAKLVRSKNAKSFLLTIDIMFESELNYRRVKDSGVISKESVSGIYGVPPENILLLHYDEGFSIKMTMPRPYVQGDPRDGDTYGGQQHSPLLNIEIP